MKVLLISANTEKMNMPTFPLGLACVAQATIEAGHEIKWLDLMAETKTDPIIRDAINSFRPGLIGISVRNIDDQNMESPGFLLERVRDIVLSCKKYSTVPAVVGGAGYSMFPESGLDYLGSDMGIQGEGEGIFPVLIDCIDKGEDLSLLPGLYIRGEGLQGKRQYEKELDKFPLPEPSLFPTSVYKSENFFMPVQTRRGCPMGCSYCSTATVEGNLIRKRSADTVLRWLAKWEDLGINQFQFVDNTFNLPASYANDLCSKMLNAPFKMLWRCILYPGNLEEKLIENMARAGCIEASLGFESGCESILKGMKKRFKLKDVSDAVKMLLEHKIKVMGFLMLGGPGETKESVMESLDFVSALALSTLKITVGIRIYPDTELAKIAVKDGLIKEDDNLLLPQFYMGKGLEEWLRQTIMERARQHPNWIV